MFAVASKAYGPAAREQAVHEVILLLDSPVGSGRISRSIPEGAKLYVREATNGARGLQDRVGGTKRLRRSRWEPGGGGQSRVRRAYSAPRTPAGWADTDECRPRSAPRISWSTIGGQDYPSLRDWFAWFGHCKPMANQIMQTKLSKILAPFIVTTTVLLKRSGSIFVFSLSRLRAPTR